CGLAKTLAPSDRGELEITDLNIKYMEEGRLKVKLLGDDVRWLDAGTFDSLLEAGNFIKDVQTRTAKNVGCPEEIALKNGFVTKEEVIERISKFKDNSYQIYVKGICGIKPSKT
ncbi:MAG: glucose-1-phosphate thymidylyltransferase, partial [Gammaproteobacteria bacterium]|nr:glucose-1-phosphate thymidylyltransferase [Gammaproteobacteria bacterium]